MANDAVRPTVEGVACARCEAVRRFFPDALCNAHLGADATRPTQDGVQVIQPDPVRVAIIRLWLERMAIMSVEEREAALDIVRWLTYPPVLVGPPVPNVGRAGEDAAARDPQGASGP